MPGRPTLHFRGKRPVSRYVIRRRRPKATRYARRSGGGAMNY